MIPVHIWGLKLPSGPRFFSIELAELNVEPYRFRMPIVHESEEFSDLPNLLVNINAEIIKEKGHPNVQIICLDHQTVKLMGDKVKDCCHQAIQFAYFCNKTHVLLCDLTGSGAGDDEAIAQSDKIHCDLKKLAAQWSCFATYVDLCEIIQPDHWVSPFHLGQHGQEKLARIINRSLMGIPPEVFNY
jgi:hypothetical protein